MTKTPAPASGLDSQPTRATKPAFPKCCEDNVKAINGILCDWDTVCKPLQDAINIYCKDAKEKECAPVPQIPGGKVCYCCCSCFAYNTPIEAATGEYVMVQDIIANVDQILAGSFKAGDGAPRWEQRVVEYSDGISAGAGEAELEFDYMFYLAYQAEDGSTPPQFVITTVDHLFLRPNGKVTPIQYLTPNDTLVSSHGGISRVLFVVPARYKGGLHHLSFAGFDNKTLDNHLLSANGIVSADYSVQLAYSNGDLNPELVDEAPAGGMLRASEDAYHARYACKEALDFIADKKRWAPGMTPIAAEPMVNIPLFAASYLTAEQAADIGAAAPMLPPDSTVGVSTALWLFKIFDSFFADPVYLIDWHNSLPNAYTWEAGGQRFVLLTGGLLRVEGFAQDGVSLVLAHLVAVAGGIQCIGPADYNAVFAKTRQIWRNNLFASSFLAGYEQVSALFGYVSTEHAKGNPADRCGQPSLDCRLEAMAAAASMMPLPECANPDIYFGLVSAKAGRQLAYVSLEFNSSLNPETAETKGNYAITSPKGTAVTVKEAEVSLTTPNVARLRVAGLKPLTDYKVVVTNVLSSKETSIDPAHNSATFRAGPKLN